jgi:mannose-6-phosphate isomerase-like protein (cupin superfamily)
VEYGFILKGILEITLGFEIYRLGAGASISFDSSRPHRLAHVGDVPVEAIWVNWEFLDSFHATPPRRPARLASCQE